MDGSRARRLGGASLGVLAVVALALVVALASRPADGSSPLLPESASRFVLDVVLYLFIACCLLGALLVAWALWPRSGEAAPRLERPRGMLGGALVAAFAVLLVVWLRHRSGQPLETGQQPGELPGPPVLPGVGPGAGPAGVDWLALGVVACLLALAALLVWRSLGPRPSARGQRTALAAVERVLDDALDDVLHEADPRRAVIAAWARLEQVLASHAMARREPEAPFEYAARAGRELRLQAGSLERMAGLFEWARFSLHEVTPAMREEALRGLLAVRDGLRVAA